MSFSTPSSRKYTSRWQMLTVLAIVALLCTVLGISLLSVRTNQDIRQKASSGNPDAVLTFNSHLIDNSHLQVDLNINTQGSSLAAIDLTGNLSGINKNSVSMNIGNNLPVNTVAQTLQQNGADTTFHLVQLAIPDPNNPASTHGQDKTLVSFVISFSGSFQTTASLDLSKSQVSLLGISNPQIQFPNNNQVNLQSTVNTTAQDNGIHRSCNQYCADTRECGSGFTCYFNQCRNPQNVTDASCQNAPAPSPVPRPRVRRVTKTASRSAQPITANIVSIDNQSVDAFASPSPIATQSAPTPTPALFTFALPTPLPSPTPTPSPTTAPLPAVTVTQSSGFAVPGSLITVIVIGIVVLIVIGGAVLFFLRGMPF